MCAATMSYDLKLGGTTYGATPEVVPRARPGRGRALRHLRPLRSTHGIRRTAL